MIVVAVGILIVAALLCGFLVLTSVEARRGTRVFSKTRDSLDVRVAGIVEIVSKIDLGVVVWHALKAIFHEVVHEAAHTTLLIVRGVERLLTRGVRYLRERREHGVSTLHDLTKPVSEIKDGSIASEENISSEA